MQRITEPELMDDAEQAAAYAAADFSAPNALFIESLLALQPDLNHLSVLDIGCGPGDICLALAAQFPDACICGIDGSVAMLDIARQKRDDRNSGLHGGGPEFLHYVLPEHDLPAASVDVILSNSLLHHLHEPQVLWQSVIGLGRPGCRVCVMDLLRPDSIRQAREIVNRHAAGEHEVLKRDFYHSLLAAFRPAEVQDQLVAASLSQLEVRVVSDRHLLVSGCLPGGSI